MRHDAPSVKQRLASTVRHRRRSFLAAGVLAAGASARALQGKGAESRQSDSLDNYIDAHAHVWTSDTDRYPLAPGFSKDRMAVPNFGPEDLLAHARPCGVRRILLIQMSYYGYDNRYLLQAMREHPGIFSGIARIDEAEISRDKVIELARQGIRGFRIVAGSQPPDRWLDGDGMATTWKLAADEGLAICPLLNPAHLPALGAMCRKFPRTSVVIDHLGRIGADGQIRAEDLDKLCALRGNKSVRIKLSAFYALGSKKAPYLDLAPMIRRALDAFTPERLMWASDSPFQVLGGHRYRDSIGLIRERLDFLTPGDRDWLLRRTAKRVFFS